MSGPTNAERFYALDGVRAMAMLLGVFYHAMLFGGMMQGFPPAGGFGPSGGPSITNSKDADQGMLQQTLVDVRQYFRLDNSQAMQEWLHCFRMPLFFLISGFFCHMMYLKYGLKSYLVRRWWKLGLPLMIGMFTFVPLYKLAENGFRGGPPMGGFGPPGAFGGPVGGGPPGASFDPDDLPPPPPGFVPPPLQQFDTNHDGTIDAEEWKIARKELPPPPPGFFPPGMGMPGFGPPGFGPGGPGQLGAQKNSDKNSSDHPVDSPSGNAARPLGPPMMPGGPMGGMFGPPGMGPGGPDGGGPFGPPGVVSSRIFGPLARFFTLSHLWFLWYLIVFATLAPFLSMIVGAALFWMKPTAAHEIGRFALRWQIVPLLLGIASYPALLATRPFFGWSLGFAAGIGRGFPDFLWHFESDMPFYFVYFFAGWWLFQSRHSLNLVASGWYFNLLIGLLIHSIAITLSRRYSSQSTLPHFQEIRMVVYAIYAVGSATTAWGFLGMFQHFANRPSIVGRYLADTAFWVYLMHQAMLFPFLAWLAPLKLSWWLNGCLATIMSTAVTLLLYESIVRPTVLLRLFGAGSVRGTPTDQSTLETAIPGLPVNSPLQPT